MDFGGAIVGVFLVVLAFIIASIPVIKLIGWWLDGGVEPLAAMVGIFLYVALAAAVVGAPSAFKVAILALLVLSAVMMPFLGQISDKVQNQSIESDRFSQYTRALEQDPMNPVARIALAEALYRQGDHQQAIEHMTWTLQQFPKLAPRISPQLDAWKREQQREGAPQWFICHQCYSENPPGATACENCGAAFGTRSGIQQRIQMEGGPRVIVRGWIVTASSLLLIGFVLLELPAIVAGPIICGTVIVAFWLFLRWVGGDMGTTGD